MTDTCPTCDHNLDWHNEEGCTISYCQCKTLNEPTEDVGSEVEIIAVGWTDCRWPWG